MKEPSKPKPSYTADFRDWWKEHTHAGFFEDRKTGRSYWTIKPSEAWRCARYRIEYERATALDTGLSPKIHDQWRAVAIDVIAESQGVVIDAMVDDQGTVIEIPIEELR